MTVRSDLLRHRIEGLSDSEERGRLVRILDDLSAMDRVLDWSERWPKTLRRHGVTVEHVARARWCADRLHEELTGRLQRAEGAKESA